HASPQLRDLPIRVVAAGDGFFEIVDGFKRFARWTDEARAAVPAVVENARSTIEPKLLLLRANAPPRTTTPMDEARVIQSLLEEHLVRWAARRQARGAPRTRTRRPRRSRLVPAPHRGPHRCRTPPSGGAASSGPRPTPTNRSSTAVNLRGESR